jgi:predicted DNA binding protein
VRGYESVTNLDVLSHHGETALLQFETTSPLLLTAVQDSGIPLEMPFDLVDGEATWEITAPQDALSTLGRQLEEFGIPFHVERIEQTVQPDQLLTDTQRALLTTAVELGYYDTPRECSLTELADEMGLAKSTCSETLHRAEERVVKAFLDGAASSVRATA